MDWQLIFLQSKINGGLYLGDELPVQKWEWPTHTWFQERLRNVREREKKIEEKMNHIEV
ncbi:MAG: hypothetical protein HY695_23875 [Deltaproteobacteria bacterium]|nr:hypothetical protein [Deltaproteobacteria bacterium]